MIYIQETMNKIKKVILPSIPDDHFSSRKITLLGTISLAMFILAVLTLINNLLFGITHENYRLYFVILSILTSIFLLKNNKINLSINVLLYGTLAFLVSVIIAQDGIHDRALFAYPGLLVAAALLYEKKGFAIFSAITIISVPVIGYLEIEGMIINKLSFSTTYAQLINAILIFIITAVFLRILVSSISDSLIKLRLNENELRNQKELISQSENKFKSLFEGSIDPILLLDENIKFIDCNNATVKILGASSRSEIIGKTPAELSPKFQPDGLTSVKKAELLIQNTKLRGNEKFEWIQLKSDGSEFFVEISLSEIVILGQKLILVHWRDITERKQAEEALKQSQRRLNLAVEGAEIGLWDQDFKTKTVYRNENWAKMLGYDPEEISSKRDFWLNIIHPDDFNHAIKDIDDVDKGLKDSSKTIQRLRCKDGSYKWVLNWGKISERDENGNPLRATGVHLDIDDRMKAQELLKASEEKFRSIIQGLTDLIFIFDGKGKIVFQSPSVYKTLGYSEKDTIGRSPFQFLHPDDVRSTERELFRILSPTYDSKPFLQRVKHKDGYYVYLESIGINMVDNHFVKGVVVLSRDVTEKIKTDAALNESENRFSDLVNNIQDPILILSFEGTILFTNPACYKLVQLDETAELIGQSFSKFMSMNEALRAFTAIKEVERNGGPITEAYEIYTVNGETRWIDTTGKKIVYEGRDVNLITIKDITENKLAQDVLANSEQRFKSVWENALDAMRLTDENGTIVLVNQAYCNLVEKNRVEVEGSNLSVVSQKEYKNIVQAKYIENFHHRNFNTKYECYLELWNNKKVYVEVAHTFISVAEHPELLLTVFHDISSRKIAEDDLKLSEEKYRNLFDTMPNGYYRSTRDGYFIDANSAFIKMLGYESLEELKKIYIPEKIYVKPSEREDVLSNNPEFVEHLETYRLKTKDGRIIWVEDNARYITDEEGNILYNEGICKEITDRKNAEDAVRESEIRFSIAFNSSPAPLVISEIESGKIIDVNEQWIRMLGYSREENLGRSSKDLGIWADPFIRDEAINDAKEKRYFKNIPVRFITKSGDFRDVYWSAEVISLKGNDVLLSMIYDYTEQKISEDRLKENEERFRIIVEQTGQLVYDYDLTAERIYRLGAIEMLTSYSSDELQKTEEDAWLSKIHPEDLKNAEKEFREAIKNVSVYNIEYRFRKKDNSYVYFEDNGVVIPDENGIAIRVLGSVKDISDRKLKFMEEIERSKRLEKQSAALVEISTHESLLRSDFQGALQFITEKISKVTNTDRAGIWLYEMNDSVLICKDIFIASANEHSSGYILEAKEYPKYFESLHNKLTIDANDARTDIRTAEFLNSYLIPMGITSMLDVAIRESGRTIGVLCLEHTGEKRIWSEDEISFALHAAEQFSVVISNYKQQLVEEALEKSERQYRTLMESLNEAVMLVDNDDTILFVNNKFTQMMGYTPEEIIGKIGYEVLFDPADKEIIIKSNAERIEGKSGQYEVRQIKKNGESIDLLVNGSPVYDDQGNVIGSLGAMTDITDRKRAEKLLRESEIKYFTLFENASDAIFLMQNEIFIECNNRTLEMFGCGSREQIIGQPPYKFSPPIQPDGSNSRESAIEKISAAINGKPQFFEWVHSKLDGKLFYAEVSLNTVELGGKVLIQAIVRDIDERKKSEEALSKSEEMYRTIISTVPDLIIRTDIDGNIIFMNEKAFPALPYLPLENFHGKNFIDFISPDDRSRAMKNFELMFKQTVGPKEYKFVFEDGYNYYL